MSRTAVSGSALADWLDYNQSAPEGVIFCSTHAVSLKPYNRLMDSMADTSMSSKLFFFSPKFKLIFVQFGLDGGVLCCAVALVVIGEKIGGGRFGGNGQSANRDKV